MFPATKTSNSNAQQAETIKQVEGFMSNKEIEVSIPLSGKTYKLDTLKHILQKHENSKASTLPKLIHAIENKHVDDQNIRLADHKLYDIKRLIDEGNEDKLNAMLEESKQELAKLTHETRHLSAIEEEHPNSQFFLITLIDKDKANLQARGRSIPRDELFKQDTYMTLNQPNIELFLEVDSSGQINFYRYFPNRDETQFELMNNDVFDQLKDIITQAANSENIHTPRSGLTSNST